MSSRAATRAALAYRLVGAAAFMLVLLALAAGNATAAEGATDTTSARAQHAARVCSVVRRRIAQHRLPHTRFARARAARCRRLAARQHRREPQPALPIAEMFTVITPIAPATPIAAASADPVVSPAPVTTPAPAPKPKPSTPKPPTTTTPRPPPTTTPTTTTPPPTTTPTTPPPTTPPPPSPPAGSLLGWNGFGAGSWPDATWRPYAASSPFNQRISASTAVHPASAQMIQTVLSWDLPGSLVAGNSQTSSDYGHPTYWSQPTDPVYSLHATGSWNAIEGMQIPVPAAAQPAGGSDGHMTIVTPDGWEYDLWQAQPKPAGGGTLTFAIGGRTRIDGSGLNSPATASNFANMAGIIRAQEMADGEIDHALFVVLKCTSSATTFGYGTQAGSGDQAAYVYPASHGGASCGSADSATAPPMGARFQLNMTDEQIAALRVPAWKKTILTALAHYGGYVGDTGGPGFGLQFESSATYTVFGVTDPLVTFAQQAGIEPWNDTYVFNMAPGVDWAQYLRIVVPPAS